MSIPLLDMKAQYATIKTELDAAVLRVLENCQYVLGKEVAAFEEKFSQYCATRHAIAVNTGTSALHLSLLALGIKPDDEVITVSMTFIATVAAIYYTGAKAVLVDVDPITWNMDPQKLERAITPRTKAIIPVHLHGLMADMNAIQKIADKYNLPIIEDACQAHGATYYGKRAGSMGKFGAFSFYPGKNLGACGEGGGIVTNDDELAKKVRLLRDWGAEKKYHHILKGYNYRLEAIQGAVLDVKMKYIEAWTERRRQAAQWYVKYLKDVPVIAMPAPPADYRHVYHMFAVRVKNRDQVQEQLNKVGIGTGIHYPIPVHLQLAYADLGYRKGDFPVTEQLANEFLSLPMYPELTEEQVRNVCHALRQALQIEKVHA